MWELKVEKSMFDPGPAPTSSTVVVEDRGDGMLLRTVEGINAQGDRTFEQIAFKRDGKEYPTVDLGAEVPRSASVKLVDAYTEEVFPKVDGKASPITITAAISEDGKTMTVTYKGTNAQGQAVDTVRVYERPLPVRLNRWSSPEEDGVSAGSVRRDLRAANNYNIRTPERSIRR